MKKTVLHYILLMMMAVIITSCGGSSDEVPSLLTPPDNIAPTISLITPPSDGTFIYNQNLGFQITFSESVVVTGTPVVEISVDGSMVTLPYIGGSGTATLTFNKNIDFERVDANGIDLNAINLSGGNITDNANNVAVLTITPTNYPLVLVDSIRPMYTSAIFNSGETYTQSTAATINSVVTGAAEMIVSTASDCSTGSWVAYSSALAHTLTANAVNNTYVSYRTSAGSATSCFLISITHDNLAPGSAVISHAGDATLLQTDTALWPAITDNGPAGILRYEYAVSTTTSDANIIVGGNWVDLSLGLTHQITSGVTLLPATNYYTLVKAVDNAGNESITASSPWQIILPQVTGVTPPANNTYGVTDVLQFIATTNKAVTVTGFPRITLDIGGVTRYADYVPGASTSTSLVFEYTIVSGDNDLDGIGHSSPIDLNGGTIQDALTNNCALVFTPADTSSVLVDDAVTPTKLVITTQPSDTPKDVSINPAITVELRDASDILAASSTDNVTIAFGTDPSAGAATLGGTLTVAAVAGVATFNDINIDTALAGYTLTVTSGVLSSDTSVSFEITPSPVITSVTPPANNTYNVSENLDFVVNFDRSVTVTGFPRIALDIGGSTVYADYVSGSPGTALTFRYTIQAGDNDADGIAHSSPIDLNTGTIIDTVNSNNALLSFTPADTSGVLVSTIIVPTKLVFVSQPVDTVSGDNITPAITVELRDAADNLANTYTDNVTLAFGTDPSAGAATLGGTLTVAAVAGVATFSDINIDNVQNGYTLTASATGLTSDTSSAFNITPIIDTLVTSIIEPVNGTYAQNGELLFQVNYNEAVTVTGFPRIILNIGGVTRYATYTTGSGGTGLEFKYTIQAGENDGDGIAVSSTNIDLNSGTIIAVSDSVTASLDFSSYLDSTAGVLVDTSGAITPPDQVTGVVTAPTTSNTELSVTWSIPNDNGTAIVNYSLQYREQGQSTWNTLSPSPTVNSATIGGLSTGITYEVRVAANNGILGPYSAISTAEVFDLTSLNLAMWLDFSDPNALYTDTGCTANVTTDGDGVACVTDKSGYGRDFIQATPGSRPAYRVNALNGLPGLEFDGAGDFLEDADGENYINSFQAFEFFVVIKSDVTSTDRGILDTEDPDGADDGITLRYDVSGASGGCTNCMKGGVQRTDGTHVQSESATGSQSTSAQVVGASWETGTKFNIYLNGSLSQSWDNGTMTGTIGLATKVIIGKGPKDTGASSWDGKIVEVVFLNTSTSTADRTTITNYLKSKWGIP